MTVAPAEGPTHLIDPRFVTRIGLIAVYGLVVVGLLVQYARYGLDSPTMMGFGPLFDPAREQNVPTWFSSTLLYSSALALVLVGLRMRRAGDRDAVWWLVLAGVFCLGSLDETATLHELISRLIRRIPDLTVVPLRPWVIVLGPVALVFILVYARFIARQDARVSRSFALGTALFVGGALGVEIVETIVGPGRVATLELALTMMLQETMELFGAVILLHASLTQLTLPTPGFDAPRPSTDLYARHR